jgi:hypothetical protein
VWSAESGYRPQYLGQPLDLDRTRLTIGGSYTMLWTILVILAIIAIALFIFGSVRGRRGL